MRLHALLLLALCAQPALVRAVPLCELDGQPVNPSNGATIAGKSGLMRCRDGEAGLLVREQELKNGVFMGLVRLYKEGVLQREYSLNDRGNKEGRSREFAATPGVSNLTLDEEIYRNGLRIGLARHWHANGQLRRVSFHGSDGREQALAEFTQQGRLKELRCAAQPQLAPDADDSAWCGHRGNATSVTLYAEDGRPRGSLVHERGQLRRSELLWAAGAPRELIEMSALGGVERSFSETGVKRRERQWVDVGPPGKTRPITILEREYQDGGTLVRERVWKPGERGGDLQLEQRWYLNGQLKEKQEYLSVDNQAARRETQFHSNGRLSSEGLWLIATRHGNQASGVHTRYDSDGHLRLEQHHDARGRITREREFDEVGQLKRDDELLEDGSRKAFKPKV